MVDSTDFNKWLKRASQDLRTASNNLQDDPVFLADAICYSCQQAAEKAMKAYLLSQRRKVPNTHDLRYLLQLCRSFDSEVDSLQEAIRELSEYAVEARYPGDNFGDITADDAKQAYECSGTVVEYVSSRVIKASNV